MMNEEKQIASRIGKKSITIPDGVEVRIDQTKIAVKGKLGTLEKDFKSEVDISVEENKIFVHTKGDGGKYKALHGLWRSLIQNMVQGVYKGFNKELSLVGVGYRAELAGKQLKISVGYSNPVMYNIPEGIKIEVEKQISVIISGIDKTLVGDVAAKLRRIRPPEPYKQKGIRYKDEIVIKKEGKSGSK